MLLVPDIARYGTGVCPYGDSAGPKPDRKLDYSKLNFVGKRGASPSGDGMAEVLGEVQVWNWGFPPYTTCSIIGPRWHCRATEGFWEFWIEVKKP